MIRALVADDQALVRLGLRVLLETENDIMLVGEAADGREAVEQVRQAHPDVVLMDIRMPVMDGLEALRTIVSDPEVADTRVVMLTTFELDEYVFAALNLGASGFVLKDSEPVELLRAVRVVACGESLLSPSVTRRVIGELVSRRATPRASAQLAEPLIPVDALTEREREIVALVGEGLSNHDIAERLAVSPATARTHVSRAMVKLQARDRAQLVVFAYQSGLCS
jgi:DNA-binding NarL/FixJ family response regulator